MMENGKDIRWNEIDVNSMITPKLPGPKEPLLPRIASIVLHPFLMLMYGVCLLFVYADFKFIFGGQFWLFFLPVFILSFLIPLNGLFLLKKAKLIHDYELIDPKERFLPLLIVFCCYTILFLFFYYSRLYNWFLGLLFAPILLVVITAVISLRWKISAHMIGIGSLIGGVLSVSYNVKGVNPYFLFIILFILAGYLGVSRLKLNRHTPGQVYSGFLLGLSVTYLSVFVAGRFV